MISQLYTITNKRGESFTINDMVSDTANFIALQDYPTFDVDYKNSEIAREGQHKIWDFYSFYGKRAVTFSGVLVGTTENNVEELKKKIQRVLAFPNQPTVDDDGYVTLTWTDPEGLSWQIEAKAERPPRFQRSMKQTLQLRFNLTLKCPDPVIRSQIENTVTGVMGYSATSLFLPTVVPFSFLQAYTNQMSIYHNGTFSADTVIRLYGHSVGTVTNPTIKNVRTGQYFKVNTTLAGPDNFIEIDSQTGSVVNEAGTDLSMDIEAGSEFILLSPTNNELVYVSDDVVAQTPTAVVTIKYRNSMI